MKTLLIDNYDSFTFNLYHLLAAVNGESPRVVRNDECAWAELAAGDFDNIVISPGPGHPARARDFGVSREAIARARVPLLGVCLGHQGIAHAFGARVDLAPEPRHGRSSLVHHDGQGLFAGLPSPFSVVRYHSLAVQGALPPELIAQAHAEDGVLMALRHAERPLWGVQFHPESIQSEFGRELLQNFRRLTEQHRNPRVESPRAPASRIRVDVGAAAEQPAPAACRLRVHAVPMRASAEGLFVAAFARSEPAFWLDSSKVIEGTSRFSYMGDATGPLAHVLRADSLEELESALRRQPLRSALDARWPFAFRGGYVGYVGFEGESRWIFADRFIAIDHVARVAYVAELSADAAPSDWARAMRAHIENPAPPPPPRLGDREAPLQFSLRDDRGAYTRKIEQCLAEIREGESYELCLTNAITARAPVNPCELYRTLRRLNPAPYAAYLKFAGHAVLSSSPERFLNVDAQGRMEARPIKGTARRSPQPLEDRRLAAELARGEKNRAENLMIVDLLRNDLGRVARPGSVEVPRLMEVETYASVHQLVSTIRGQLDEGRSALQAVRAAFPGGSMTGAPKQRSLEILRRLEGGPRGIYAGALGYLSLDGALDLSIVIRTIIARGAELSIGVGGAIVSLSSPDAEFEETLLKASVPLQAIALAVTGRREGYLLVTEPGLKSASDRSVSSKPRPTRAP